MGFDRVVGVDDILGKVKLVDSTGVDSMGKVTLTPDAYTQLRRLKDIVDAVAALGYEFTINGVNFNDYGKIKALTLDGDAKDDNPQTLHDGGANYQVPSDKVFIAFQATIYIFGASAIGRIGESTTLDGAIDGTGEVLSLANGTNLPFMTSCIGVFGSGKFITAETTSNSIVMKASSILYGVEVDS